MFFYIRLSLSTHAYGLSADLSRFPRLDVVYPATEGDVIRYELCTLEEADVVENGLFQVREGEKVHVSRLELGEGVGAAARKKNTGKRRQDC